jgi:hypothetical protein
MSSFKFYNLIKDLLLKSNNLENSKNIFWKVFYDANVSCNKCAKDLKIVLLNAPCYGFGDIIYAMKLAKYLRSWYGAKVTIASPQPKNFLKLGESPKNLLLLKGAGNMFQCRRLQRLKFRTLDGKLIPTPTFDLLFVAPLAADFDPELIDVKKLIPYANKVNTKFWSEYNDYLDKYIDFNIGVGSRRLGLFMTSPKVSKRKLIKVPYAFAYIAEKTEQVPDADLCFTAFLEMIAAKYSKKHSTFTLVAPPWVEKHFSKMINRVYPRVKKYYPTIILQTKKETKVMKDGNGKKLIVRTDVLPVPNKDMMNLMKYSVKDILLTGDQSITDALSCCGDKNIFYQRVAWKENFANNLAKLMPNKWLKSSRTSCGSIKAIKYKSHYKNFLKDWDFRNRGRRMTDAVILMGKSLKKSKKMRELADIVAGSRTLNAMKRKIRNL